MEEFNLKVGNDLPVQKPAINRTRKQKFIVQKHISSLIHSCHCDDVNCKLRDCQKMRKIKHHKNPGKGCFICRKINALKAYHTKYCTKQKNSRLAKLKKKKNLKQAEGKSSFETKQIPQEVQGITPQQKQLSPQPSQHVSEKSQIQAISIQSTKEWHQSILPDLRNQSIYKLIQFVFPRIRFPNPSLINDKRMSNIIAYGKNIEADIYKTAESKSEYYHLLALKIYELQKKIEEKMLKRNQQSKIPEKLKKIQLPQGFTLVQAIPVEKTKEWHQSVPLDHRNHLVYRFIQAVFPNSDPRSLKDQRMSELVAFAKKIESETYETAESRPQYHYLLADKLYKIEKKFEMKRKIYKIEKELERSSNV